MIYFNENFRSYPWFCLLLFSFLVSLRNICLLTQDSYFQFKSRKYALGSSFWIKFWIDKSSMNTVWSNFESSKMKVGSLLFLPRSFLTLANWVRWSANSIRMFPLSQSRSNAFVNMFSIRVCVVSLNLVGWVISGRNPLEVMRL